MSYKPQSLIDYESTPEYAVKHYRNISQEVENNLDDFLFWLEYDNEETTEETVKEITKLVNEYLGRDMPKVKKGELSLLKQWTKAAKGES